MKSVLVSLIIFSSIAFSQENKSADTLNLFSPSNIKNFADYLFCQQDYLRAAAEYQRYLSFGSNDTVEFKIGIAYSSMGDYNSAADKFNSIKKNSLFYPIAQMEFLKSVFQTEDYPVFRNIYTERFLDMKEEEKSRAKSLYNFSYLFTKNSLPDENSFINTFPKGEQNRIKSFYEWKKDPPEKSPFTAALLSAVIPGAGKFYVHKYSDGIWGFLTSVGFAFLAYDNFHAGHNFRAWVFTGLAAGFYAGNIYGSAAAAQIYNVQINMDFVNELRSFLENQNYFLPVFNFCK